MDFPKVFPLPDAWLLHRVSYGETDAMGVLYYAEYLHIFERARGLFIRQRGMGYAKVEARGILLPVREAWCRYRSPSRYDDEIHVRCGIVEWNRASLRFVYEIKNPDRDRLLAQGGTEHACVNRQGRPVGVPDWLKELFGRQA
ncbi:MAG: acyl-CoA thioesterase [Proteobacteria bacterium]|nr:acyl-CoA thioesterase [Pseudomonadota bacterium]MBU1594825.1 acyl-CoA thioesterase [Pseudomonadota bacterium]